MPASRSPTRFHDVAVGGLAGAGTGLVAGLYLTARVAGGSWVPMAGMVAGAVLGILWLSRLDPHRSRLPTPRVVVAWILLGASATLLVGLAFAIAGLE